MKDWKVGDVIQVDPAHDLRFGGCLMIVEEVKSWGVQGYVQVPAQGLAYYRLNFEFGEKIGTAVWLWKNK